MAKLWEKDYSTDKLIEEFTVGRDYRLDMNLIPSDCIASIAHARMLSTIDILSKDDFYKLKKECRKQEADLNQPLAQTQTTSKN